jgi:hypothetical protein
MPLGLGKKSAERLGIKLSDINRVANLAPYGYFDWQEKRDDIQKHFPQTDKWLMQCHNMPSQDECIMEMFNELLDGFGVEAIKAVGAHVDNYHFDIVADYVNTGDTYNTTILHDHVTSRFMVTSWGDYVESKRF